MTNYTLHGKNIVHMTHGSYNLHFFYDASNKPAIVEYNGTKYTYVHNLQGDIVAILDSNGTAVVQYKYDAWGKPISKTGSMANTLGTVQPFRYRGYVYDEETELYYLKSRYINPAHCRFLNADCVLSTSNLFAYCSNCPVFLTDPTGCTEENANMQAMYLVGDCYLNKEQLITYTAFWLEYSDCHNGPLTFYPLKDFRYSGGYVGSVSSIRSYTESIYHPYALEAVSDFMAEDFWEFSEDLGKIAGLGVSTGAMCFGVFIDPVAAAEKGESIGQMVSTMGSVAIELIGALVYGGQIPESNHWHTRHVMEVRRNGPPRAIETYSYQVCNQGICELVLTHTIKTK